MYNRLFVCSVACLYCTIIMLLFNHRLKRGTVGYGFGEFLFIFLFLGIFSSKNQIERGDVIAMGLGI